FWNTVLHRVLRQLDLDAGLGLEFLDGVVECGVFGRIEALHPPNDHFFLCRRRRSCAERTHRSQRDPEPRPQLHERLLEMIFTLSPITSPLPRTTARI